MVTLTITKKNKSYYAYATIDGSVKHPQFIGYERSIEKLALYASNLLMLKRYDYLVFL